MLTQKEVNGIEGDLPRFPSWIEECLDNNISAGMISKDKRERLNICTKMVGVFLSDGPVCVFVFFCLILYCVRANIVA